MIKRGYREQVRGVDARIVSEVIDAYVLSDRDREIIKLNLLHGMSYTRISEIIEPWVSPRWIQEIMNRWTLKALPASLMLHSVLFIAISFPSVVIKSLNTSYLPNLRARPSRRDLSLMSSTVFNLISSIRASASEGNRARF